MSFSSTLDRPEATTLSIDDLFRDVKNGKIKIPRFQRKFRWESDDMLKLLDSIYRGYPIGNLLFWETDFDQGAKSVFGPVVIEETAKVTKLIIDGQQRISTLVGIFLLSDNEDYDRKWYVYFDLRTKKFEILKKNAKAPYYWIPLREVSDTIRFLTWLRNLSENKETELLIDEANQMAKALRDYKIPAYIVRTDDERILRKIFERLNKGGKPLTDTEVFNSLFGRTDDTEPDDLSAIRKKFEKYGFGSIKGKDLLKSLLAILDIDITIKFDKAKDLLKENKDEKDVHKTITGLHDALKIVVDFLERDAGVCHMSLLPYPFSLIPLIKFFYLFPQTPGETRKELSWWFWRATTSGFFHRITAQPIKQILKGIKGTETESIKKLIEISEDFSYSEIKMEYVGLGNATTKIFCNYLIALNPKDFITGEPFDTKAIIEKEGSKVFQAFTKMNRGGSHIENKDIEKGFCNRFFYPTSKFREISDNKKRSDFPILKSHAIPPEILVCWKKGEIEEFLERRGRFIEEDMEKYLKERRGQR